jgi:hypothetical protein
MGSGHVARHARAVTELNSEAFFKKAAARDF